MSCSTRRASVARSAERYRLTSPKRSVVSFGLSAIAARNSFSATSLPRRDDRKSSSTNVRWLSSGSVFTEVRSTDSARSSSLWRVW